LRSCSHRRLTSPPSLWPGRELRKYHYRCPLSSPNQEQLGISSRMGRSSRNRGSWRSAAQAIPDSNVVLSPRLPDGCIFSFQTPSGLSGRHGLSLGDFKLFFVGRAGRICSPRRTHSQLCGYLRQFFNRIGDVTLHHAGITSAHQQIVC